MLGIKFIFLSINFEQGSQVSHLELVPVDYRQPNCLKDSFFIKGSCYQLLNDGENHVIIFLNYYEWPFTRLKDLFNSDIIVKIKLLNHALSEPREHYFELLYPAIVPLSYFA